MAQPREKPTAISIASTETNTLAAIKLNIPKLLSPVIPVGIHFEENKKSCNFTSLNKGSASFTIYKITKPNKNTLIRLSTNKNPLNNFSNILK